MNVSFSFFDSSLFRIGLERFSSYFTGCFRQADTIRIRRAEVYDVAKLPRFPLSPWYNVSSAFNA